jgi:hypothetical protein
MFIKVDLYTFRQQFKDMGRGDNFSYEGLELLFDYLDELEHCEEEYELDVNRALLRLCGIIAGECSA